MPTTTNKSVCEKLKHNTPFNCKQKTQRNQMMSCKNSNATVTNNIIDEKLVSKQTVVLHQWGSDTLKIDIKQVDKCQISTMKR